ncbi:MAG: amylo-alpha-1,6-glucosidase [Candidatus Paceibacterota bacterium]|jgi:glycogen debranching enzyme
MQITHEYKNTKIVKNTDESTGLILGNDMGNYYYIANQDETRYQGFFYSDCKNVRNEFMVYKIIDSINMIDSGKLTEIRNGFFEVSRKYENGISEKYFLPNGHNALCIKTSRTSKAEIVLDIRHPYDSRLMGRFYEIEIKNDCALIKFTKRRDQNEDGLADKKEYSLYLAIKTDKEEYKSIGQFFSKYYQKDHKRNSTPWDRFVYKAVEIEFREAVLAVGRTQKEAMDEVLRVYKNFDKLYEKQADTVHKKLKFPKISDEEIKMAYLCAQNSIYTMLVEANMKKGAYAGLPWFFQFWTRDEAISLLEIHKLKEDLSLEIINKHIRSITGDGQLPKQRFYGASENVLKSADSLGWLMDRIKKLNDAKKLPEYLKLEIIDTIEKVIPDLMQKRTIDDLAINYNNETWMDSIERSGQRIEIQAGRLKIYKTLYELTRNDQYEILESELRKKVLSKFYENGILLDSPSDKTARPNAFIAAYLYPELLSNEQWETCFDKLLERLYLPWGGISTVDIKSDMFIAHDTGENSLSYHNGNSWYWINNLVALVLYRINAHKYSEYINSIMEANTKDILYEGIAGHHSEVSSAEKKTCSGCNAQLWSSAMYLEVFDEMLNS